MVTLKDVEKHIHKYLHYGFIENTRVVITYNETVWCIKVLNPNPMLKMNIQRIINQLPDTMAYFEYPTGRYIFGPNETPQQKHDFAKSKASVIGTEMLERYKEIAKIKDLFVDAVTEMNEFKKEMKKTLDIVTT